MRARSPSMAGTSRTTTPAGASAGTWSARSPSAHNNSARGHAVGPSHRAAPPCRSASAFSVARIARVSSLAASRMCSWRAPASTTAPPIRVTPATARSSRRGTLHRSAAPPLRSRSGRAHTMTDPRRSDIACESPACPTCGGATWDNRETKRNPRAPDFKCRDRQVRRRHLAVQGARAPSVDRCGTRPLVAGRSAGGDRSGRCSRPGLDRHRELERVISVRRAGSDASAGTRAPIVRHAAAAATGSRVSRPHARTLPGERSVRRPPHRPALRDVRGECAGQCVRRDGGDGVHRRAR